MIHRASRRDCRGCCGLCSTEPKEPSGKPMGLPPECRGLARRIVTSAATQGRHPRPSRMPPTARRPLRRVTAETLRHCRDNPLQSGPRGRGAAHQQADRSPARQAGPTENLAVRRFTEVSATIARKFCTLFVLELTGAAVSTTSREGKPLHGMTKAGMNCRTPRPQYVSTSGCFMHYFGIIYFLAVTKLHLDRTYPVTCSLTIWFCDANACVAVSGSRSSRLTSRRDWRPFRADEPARKGCAWAD